MGGFFDFFCLPRPFFWAWAFSWAWACLAARACWAAAMGAVPRVCFLPRAWRPRPLSAFRAAAAAWSLWTWGVLPRPFPCLAPLWAAFSFGAWAGASLALPRWAAGFCRGPAIFPIFGASSAPLRTWSCCLAGSSVPSPAGLRLLFFFSATRFPPTHKNSVTSFLPVEAGTFRQGEPGKRWARLPPKAGKGHAAPSAAQTRSRRFPARYSPPRRAGAPAPVCAAAASVLYKNAAPAAWMP